MPFPHKRHNPHNYSLISPPHPPPPPHLFFWQITLSSITFSTAIHLVQSRLMQGPESGPRIQCLHQVCQEHSTALPVIKNFTKTTARNVILPYWMESTQEKTGEKTNVIKSQHYFHLQYSNRKIKSWRNRIHTGLVETVRKVYNIL